MWFDPSSEGVPDGSGNVRSSSSLIANATLPRGAGIECVDWDFLETDWVASLSLFTHTPGCTSSTAFPLLVLELEDLAMGGGSPFALEVVLSRPGCDVMA